MQQMSTDEAARSMGISRQRVRVLAREGRLNARKIGHRWIVEAPLGDRSPRSGRPLSAASAWAGLALLEGEKPRWVPVTALSRLRRRVRDIEWLIRVLRASEPRSRIERLRVLPSDLRKITSEMSVVATGLSAISREFDLMPGGEGLDAYISADGLRRLKRRFRPAPGGRDSNLTLRIPAVAWVLGFSQAPLAVVAADLLDSLDARAARAGRDVLRKRHDG
jgi:excisionase family DNA binding protein